MLQANRIGSAGAGCPRGLQNTGRSIYKKNKRLSKEGLGKLEMRQRNNSRWSKRKQDKQEERKVGRDFALER